MSFWDAHHCQSSTTLVIKQWSGMSWGLGAQIQTFKNKLAKQIQSLEKGKPKVKEMTPSSLPSVREINNWNNPALPYCFYQLKWGCKVMKAYNAVLLLKLSRCGPESCLNNWGYLKIKCKFLWAFLSSVHELQWVRPPCNSLLGCIWMGQLVSFCKEKGTM